MGRHILKRLEAEGRSSKAVVEPLEALAATSQSEVGTRLGI